MRGQIPSPGEEELALHLRAHKIAFQREVRIVPGRRYRWDFVIGDLAIEIQGGTWHVGAHSHGGGILRDCQKLNAAVLAGYRVLLFTTEMVQSGEAIETIREALRTTNPQHPPQ